MKNVLLALALAGGWATAEAQVATPVGVNEGARIRVKVAGRPTLVGSFKGATRDTLWIGDDGGRVRSLGASDIGSVDVSLGSPVRSGRVAKGALTGALVVGGLTALSGLGGDSRARGDAAFAAAILAPVGGLIGGVWAARTAPEQWQPIPASSLVSADGRTRPVPGIQPAKGNGKRILVGAVVGGAAGALFVQTQRSSSPKVGQYLVAVVPGMLIGGAVGALWH